MNNKSEHIDELIAKFLSGEANPEEAIELEDWRSQSPENARHFNQSKKLFGIVNGAVNNNEAWKKVERRLEKPTAKVIPLKTRSIIMGVAASIMLLLSLTLVIKLGFGGNQEVFVATNTGENTLPDGSKVFLNKNAELSYVINDNNEREVKLKGEAYFEVVHNEKEPFIVNVNDVLVKDIGTAFNVKTLPDSNIEVLVESGEVQFYTKDNEGIKLEKDEKAIYDVVARKFVKSVFDPVQNTTSYRTRIFNFKDTPLKNVIAQLNSVYGSDIQLTDEKLGNCLLTASFDNEKVDIMVRLIAETMNMEVVKLGNTLLLKGSACP